VTFHQQRPNPYAVVERGDIKLHFFSMKTYDPTRSCTEAPKERFSRALHTASLLGDSKGDHPAVAKLLDRILASDAARTNWPRSLPSRQAPPRT
jgi:hypothetical protein